MPEPHRKSPDELLRQIQADSAPQGHLKIFLGYSSGVGKSFRMLDEARRRRERGQDVVIGAIQSALAPETAALVHNLEVIPLRRLQGGSAVDVTAILRRHPRICIIDGLAYNNPPDSLRPTRWQDVAELLRAGIKVITSINVQYVAELRERVEAITGKPVAETVPEDFIRNADEIEIVDAPPTELPPDPSPETRALAREREERLSKLRELTLTLAADVVDFQLNAYLERHKLSPHYGAQERILVCIAPNTNSRAMLEEARSVAERFRGELFAAGVELPGSSAQAIAAMERQMALARTAGAQTHILHGGKPAALLLEFARAHGITQIFVGHSRRRGLARLKASPLNRLIWEGRGMDVRVFPQ